MKPKYSMIIRWSDDDECYIVWIPEFGFGIKSHGDSYEEAAREGADLVDTSIELCDHGDMHRPDPWLQGSPDDDVALGQHLFPDGFYYRSLLKRSVDLQARISPPPREPAKEVAGV